MQQIMYTDANRAARDHPLARGTDVGACGGLRARKRRDVPRVARVTRYAHRVAQSRR